MIPTLRRDRDDVFLIGEEEFLADQETGVDQAPTVAIEQVDGDGTARRHRPRSTGSLRGARGLALLGLAATAVAFTAALQLVGDRGPSRDAAVSSPRRALIARPPAQPAAGRVAHRHPRVARPLERHRPVVARRPPRRRQGRARNRHQPTQREPEREPTPQVAPVSSEAPATEPVPVPPPEEAPAAVGNQASPEPPPPEGGGGPGGVERFGFER